METRLHKSSDILILHDWRRTDNSAQSAPLVPSLIHSDLFFNALLHLHPFGVICSSKYSVP
jgi:hypothetical protein